MQQKLKGIGREITSKLVDPMPKRLQEILKNKSGPTHYQYLINNKI